MSDHRDLEERQEPRFGEPAGPAVELGGGPRPPQDELGPLGLEFESVLAPKPRRRAGLRLFLVFVGLMVAGGAAGWYLLGDRFKSAETGGDVPIVRADITPIKVRPENPGGMDVPNRDKTIYEQLGPADAREGKVERLLPPPEEPKEPVTAPPAPEPQVTTAPPAASMSPPPPPAAPDPTAPPPRSPRALMPAAPTPAPAPATPPVTKPAPPVIEPVKQGALQPAPPSQPVGKVDTIGMRTQEPAPAPVAPVAEAKPEPAPQPKVEPPPAPKPEPVAAPKPAPAPAAKGDYQVQTGAVRSRAAAETEWKRQQKAHADLLGGLSLQVVEVDIPGKGLYYRIRAAGVASEAAAKDLCAKLTAHKLPCLVVKPGH